MKSKTLGILAISAFLLLAVGLVSATNFQNRMSNEDMDLLKEAMESGDYKSWAEIKQGQISEEKFDEARTRHQERAQFRALMQEARESGNWELMEELKAGYGVGKRMHKRNINSMPCSR